MSGGPMTVHIRDGHDAVGEESEATAQAGAARGLATAGRVLWVDPEIARHMAAADVRQKMTYGRLAGHNAGVRIVPGSVQILPIQANGTRTSVVFVRVVAVGLEREGEFPLAFRFLSHERYRAPVLVS